MMTIKQARSYVDENPDWAPFADMLICPPSEKELLEVRPEASWDIKEIYGWRGSGSVGLFIQGTAIYEKARRQGSTHAMAAMVASQKAPKALTDREFFSGTGTLGQQFEQRYVDDIVYAARQKGYNPSPNDVYMRTLAREPGDPEAFVPPTGGRNHIRRVCESRGLPCEGAVNVKAGPQKEVKIKRLGDDIVNRIYHSSKDPDILAAKKDGKREAREAIISKYGNKKSTL